MQNFLVSILIPFKNTALFLPECLDSVISQTYQNWEIIVVDDHSEDNSLELLISYAKIDERIKVIKNTGQGIIPALRTAYSQSSGILITRMDSDDIMKPSRLKTMADSLAKTGVGNIAVGQVRYFSGTGISNGYARYEAWLNRLTEKGTNYSEIYKECVIPSPCWMVFRKDFDACGAFSSNRYPEDYDLTFRFYEKGLNVIPCSEVLHLWRDYNTRTSRTSEHYAQNYFLNLKLYFFLKLDYESKRPLVIWGAGFKGKNVAKYLLKKDVDFVWLCDNPKKINKKIYGQELFHFSALKELVNPQSIVTVANEEAQKEIKEYLNELNQIAMQDYFFFC